MSQRTRNIGKSVWFQVNDEVHAAMVRAAEEDGRPIAQWVRQLVKVELGLIQAADPPSKDTVKATA